MCNFGNCINEQMDVFGKMEVGEISVFYLLCQMVGMCTAEQFVLISLALYSGYVDFGFRE